ncbi:hypothetical protein [Sorangium sp. So ce1182]
MPVPLSAGYPMVLEIVPTPGGAGVSFLVDSGSQQALKRRGEA